MTRQDGVGKKNMDGQRETQNSNSNKGNLPCCCCRRDDDSPDAAPSAVPVQHSPSPIPLTPAQTPESLERIAYTRTHPSPPLPRRPRNTTRGLASGTVSRLRVYKNPKRGSRRRVERWRRGIRLDVLGFGVVGGSG